MIPPLIVDPLTVVPCELFELGVGLSDLSSLLAVSEEVEPEETPLELWRTRLGGPPRVVEEAESARRLDGPIGQQS